MDANTLTDLRGSIEKWQRIVDGTGEDRGWRNCPLCTEFLSDDCRGCPVFHETGEPFCRGTPYSDYVIAKEDLLNASELGKSGPLKAMATAARAELAFLESLLPECPATVDTWPVDGDGREVSL